ncbi:integrase core domain-containing protein [Mycobacterium canetti]|uniref:integrase core domain-containing protein n=1 Tax=Mycobacterium canetti TaxID=78331 RepID=UPI0019313486|nr:integrase core domain-containing protein [Mycobacterium canetti]
MGRTGSALDNAAAESFNSTLEWELLRNNHFLDNAAAESFNSTLEWELLRNNHFHTREEARHAVAAWIDQPRRLRTRLQSTTE